METSPKVTRVLAHKASSATSSKVLKTSHEAHMARINVSQETHGLVYWFTVKTMVKIDLAITSIQNSASPSCRGIPNPYDSTRMLNVDEGIALIVINQKTLQL